MKYAIIIAALLCIPACVTAPTDPAQLAAWNAEKEARTLARRPEAGSVLPGKDRGTDDFEEVRESLQPANVEGNWQ